MTHGEGYGLPIFEAAYNELPVIAPDWSGHVDFLYAPVKDKKTGKDKLRPHFGRVKYTLQQISKDARWDGVLEKDSLWCHAEQGSYKMVLREVYKDYNRFKSNAKKLNKWIRKNFVAEDLYDKFCSHVLEHVDITSNEEVDDMFQKLFQ